MTAASEAATRVVLVDDHALLRSGLATLLRAWGYDVVGEATNGRAAVELVQECEPDVVFMDINMPELNGIEATRAIKAQFPEIRVVILTVSDEDQDLVGAIRGGADGYLLKNMEQEELERMIEHLSRGEPVVPASLAVKLLGEFRDGDRTPEPDLTDRESEVLREVATGATSREIGLRLDISENTVNFHLKNIFSKLHLRNRAQVVGWAAAHGYMARSD